MTNNPINRIALDDISHFSLPGCATLNMYQQIAVKSAIYPGKGTPFGLMYVALGLAEAGEVQNKVKKAFRDDDVITFDAVSADKTGMVVHVQPLTPERKAQIVKELGGVLWYVAACCEELGVDMRKVARDNLEELYSRGVRGTLSGDGDNR